MRDQKQMRHLILAAAVAALCQPAWAAAKSELAFPSYDWHVTLSDRGNGGCDLVKVGDRDRALIVHADADKPFDVSVLFGRDRFHIGQTVDASIAIDGVLVTGLPMVQSPRQLAFPVVPEHALAFLAGFARGKLLVVEIGKEVYSVGLEASSEALHALWRCSEHRQQLAPQKG